MGKGKAETADHMDVMRISVRNLVEFILRSGDIDDRHPTGPDTDTMQMGSRLHRKIQKSMGSEYQAEVPLKREVVFNDLAICVEGRADGIIHREDTVIIDEIKGILRQVETLEAPEEVHLAQAKCYAYMYAEGKDLSQIQVRMTYCQLETETVRYFDFGYSEKELEEWFLDLVGQYEKWARFERDWKQVRQRSIQQTTFPFPWREGQKKLAEDVYRSILREKVLFIQAPTGVGKTLSTLFPAIKAVGEGLAEKIFYLTAKTVARTVAAQGLMQLRENGLKCKSVILTAKEKICPCEEVQCNPDNCPYAKGHFDRINDAVFQLITGEDVFDRESVLAAADRYQVCPFELSLDISTWMDVIIGDYNYAFHPRAKLKRFFGEGVKGSWLFLVDEAHNLLERGREMYSAELVKEDVLALKKAVKTVSPKLARSLERVNKHLLELKRACDGYTILDGVGTLPVSLLNLNGAIQELQDQIRQGLAVPSDLQRQILEMYFQVGTFLDVCDRLDEHYVIYDEIREDKRFIIRLLCVNPAANLQACMDKGRSTLLFSATLLPIDYYRQHLTTQAGHYAVHADSCFDPAKLQVFAGTDTSSLYTRRNAAEFQRMAEYILHAVHAKKGNYMVFFSSYRMLSDVREAFENLLLTRGETENITIMAQYQGMPENEREAFLETFSGEPEKSLIGFCVMGSYFGEGIDLKSDRLIGAIIVGPGIPMVCNEQEILRGYYARNGMDGFRYAYLCPGMNRVLQAAGRVIRTQEDRGIVLLLDERFMREDYRKMFPQEWRRVIPCRADDAAAKIKAFWDTL